LNTYVYLLDCLIWRYPFWNEKKSSLAKAAPLEQSLHDIETNLLSHSKDSDQEVDGLESHTNNKDENPQISSDAKELSELKTAEYIESVLEDMRKLNIKFDRKHVIQYNGALWCLARAHRLNSVLTLLKVTISSSFNLTCCVSGNASSKDFSSIGCISYRPRCFRQESSNILQEGNEL
jgi:hypothetical protein